MLEVTIRGATGEGKTTLAILFTQLLRGHGFQVVTHDPDVAREIDNCPEDEHPQRLTDLEKTLKVLAQRSQDSPVFLKTVQTPRKGVTDNRMVHLDGKDVPLDSLPSGAYLRVRVAAQLRDHETPRSIIVVFSVPGRSGKPILFWHFYGQASSQPIEELEIRPDDQFFCVLE